ncbi:hypothetical protein TNIN_183151 [Trichonephila inaurata madagascariensis]|uniref:Uncharacterized protein n=1 Tax=Trichonephila inaurata madagascariensis TaxID=2747483 RepID=A0A8X6MC59_9ARAC|nr:hypothetical protein TNIN_183151 [Trichonephila inaurata madagascariensis]
MEQKNDLDFAFFHNRCIGAGTSSTKGYVEAAAAIYGRSMSNARIWINILFIIVDYKSCLVLFCVIVRVKRMVLKPVLSYIE